jgi:hypothetical protein
MFKLLFILSFINLNPEKTFTFEGTIQIENINYYDTIYYIYYIKNENVRIEKYDKEGEELSVYIANLEKNTVYALNTKKHIYKTINPKPYKTYQDKQYQVIKSKSFRYINGYQCELWRVKNKQSNTEIAYWVAKDNFLFYSRLFGLLQKTDKIYDFYLHIPDNEGYMPMVIEERDLLRDLKSKIEIIKIDRGKLDDSKFEIPSNYKLFN